MRKLYLAGAGMIAVLLAMSTSATGSGPTYYAQFHGSVCQSPSSLQAFDQYGVRNTQQAGVGGTGGNSSGSLTVVCPAPLAIATSGVSLTAINLNYYDRGNSVQRVSCTAQSVDASGNPQYTETQTSPGGGPGQGIQTFTFTPTPVTASQRLFITCSLPGVNSGWFSHIAGFTVVEQTL